MDSRFSTLTLAQRAGKLVFGFEPAKKAVFDGTLVLLITASDISEKTKKEVLFLADRYELPHIILDAKIDELWYMLGRRAGVIGLTDEGFLKTLTKA